jgi:hypothetical protein
LQENPEHVTDLSITRRSTSFSGSDTIRAQLKDGHILQGGDRGSHSNSLETSPVVQVLFVGRHFSTCDAAVTGNSC